MTKTTDCRDTRPVELWTYAGRRGLSDGPLGTLWLDADGNELAFGLGKATPHGAIGATYRMRVTREEGGKVRAGVEGFEAKADDDDERVPRWVLADREAHLADEQRKAENQGRRDAASRLGDLTLREVRDDLLLRAGPRRSARLAAVLTFLNA